MSEETPFERATEPVHQILALAAEEALNRSEKSSDTIHILRAMPKFEGTIAEVALRVNNVSESAIGLDHESRKSEDITLEELSLRCIEEGKLLGHSNPGTEHLLLAIVCTPGCRGARLLRNLEGHDMREALCQSVITILGNDWSDWREKHLDVL